MNTNDYVISQQDLDEFDNSRSGKVIEILNHFISTSQLSQININDLDLVESSEIEEDGLSKTLIISANKNSRITDELLQNTYRIVILLKD